MRIYFFLNDILRTFCSNSSITDTSHIKIRTTIAKALHSVYSVPLPLSLHIWFTWKRKSKSEARQVLWERGGAKEDDSKKAWASCTRIVYLCEGYPQVSRVDPLGERHPQELSVGLGQRYFQQCGVSVCQRQPANRALLQMKERFVLQSGATIK
jgi:hypothetical protein